MELYPAPVNILVYLTIASAIAFVAWWIISLYRFHSREKEDELPKLILPEGVDEVITGVPLALIIFYIFTGVSMIGYVLYVWLGGVTY